MCFYHFFKRDYPSSSYYDLSELPTEIPAEDEKTKIKKMKIDRSVEH